MPLRMALQRDVEFCYERRLRVAAAAVTRVTLLMI